MFVVVYGFDLFGISYFPIAQTKTVKEEEEKMGVEIKEEPVEGEKEKIWDILRDDFMMNPSMKDWQES